MANHAATNNVIGLPKPSSDRPLSSAHHRGGCRPAREAVRYGLERIEPPMRGGLAPWQQRIILDYIEERLDEPIPLPTLADLAGLSSYHFCRAFRRSLGMPPHRYHTCRRIERAKSLLADVKISVTEIGLSVGFNETSSFTAAFRKATDFDADSLPPKSRLTR